MLPRSLALLVAILAFVPSSLFAQSASIELRWNACFTNASSYPDQFFACDRSQGPSGEAIPFRLIGSFVPRSVIADFHGLQARVSVSASPASISFWSFGPGSCREGALHVDLAYNDPRLCLNPFATGGALGGDVQWSLHPNNPSVARLDIAVAALQGTALTAGERYTAFDLVFDASHASGDDPPSCSGCCEPVCLVLDQVQLYDANGLVDQFSAGSAEAVAGWNGQSSNSAPEPCVVYGSCPTPGRSATWGAIKSLYR